MGANLIRHLSILRYHPLSYASNMHGNYSCWYLLLKQVKHVNITTKNIFFIFYFIYKFINTFIE